MDSKRGDGLQLGVDTLLSFHGNAVKFVADNRLDVDAFVTLLLQVRHHLHKK